MKKGDESAFRRASVLLATTLAALGVALLLTVKKVWAASFGARMSPGWSPSLIR